MKLKLQGLASHLRGPLKSVYLVTGDEPLLVDEAGAQIRGAARQQGFSSRDYFSAIRQFDWDEVRDAGQSMSLFAEKRIVHLHLPTGKPGREGSQAIRDMVTVAGDDLLFLVTAFSGEASVRKSAWAKAMDKAGAMLETWPIRPQELPRWLAQRMRDHGLVPERDAVLALARRIEGNLLAAAQEVEKLALVKQDDGSDVTAADIENWVADASQFDTFGMIDTALAGHGARAVRMLRRMAGEGVVVAALVGALTKELMTMVTLAAARDAGQPLDPIFKSQRIWREKQERYEKALSRAGVTHWRACLNALARLELASKGRFPAGEWELAEHLLLAVADSEQAGLLKLTDGLAA